MSFDLIKCSKLLHLFIYFKRITISFYLSPFTEEAGNLDSWRSLQDRQWMTVVVGTISPKLTLLINSVIKMSWQQRFNNPLTSILTLLCFNKVHNASTTSKLIQWHSQPLKDRKSQQLWHVYNCPVTVENIFKQACATHSGSVFKTLLSVIQHTHTACLFLSLSFTCSHISVSLGPRLTERGPHNFIIHCHWLDSSYI